MKPMHLHNPFKPLLVSATILILAAVAFDPSFRGLLLPDKTSAVGGHIAVDVLGQLTGADEPTFDFSGQNNSPNSRGFSGPFGIAIDEVHHRFFAVDTGHHRVLEFDLNGSNQLIDRIADHVLGQVNFRDSGNDTMTYPQYSAYDPVNDRLFVSDYSGNRVLVFDVATIDDGEPAINVLGQPDFDTNTPVVTAAGMLTPRGVAFDPTTERLFVGLQDQQRVLVFDLTGGITDGMDASWVLGQTDFTATAAGTSEDTFNSANNLTLDTSGQRLFVDDSAGNRIMVFDVSLANLASEANGGGIATNAINVIGQEDFGSGGSGLDADSLNIGSIYGNGLAYDADNERLFVGDGVNRRVLVFNADPAVLVPDCGLACNGPDAINVLGQSNFTSNDDSLSLSSTRAAAGLVYESTSGFLYTATAGDTGQPELDNRVSVFDVNVIVNGEPAIDLLGQLDENDEPVYTTRGVDNSPNAHGMGPAQGVALDAVHHRLFTADYGNNRVMVFNLDAQNQPLDPTADFILGQPDFKTMASGTNDSTLYLPFAISYDGTDDLLFVADGNNGRVMVFDTTSIITGEPAVHVIGKPDFDTGGAGTSISELSCPQGVSIEPVNGLLAVADTCNSRTLIFDLGGPGLPLLADGMDASRVFGAPDFDSNVCAVGASAMCHPKGVFAETTTDSLWVSDNDNNRVLRFDLDAASSTPASHVLGQSDFASNTATTTQSGMSSPWGVDIIERADATQRLLVPDAGNSRVLVFDITGGITDGMDAVDVYGQSSFTDSDCNTTQTGLCNPTAAQYDEDTDMFYVSDDNNNRVMLFPYFPVGGPTTSHLATDVVGQLDDAEQPLFTTDGADNGPNRRGLNYPSVSAVDTVHHRLFVQELGNSRVVEYDMDSSNHLIDHLPDHILVFPDFKANGDELGNPSFTAIAYDSTHDYLYGADWANNRVLVFDVSTITGSDEPVHVLGQFDFDATDAECDTIPTTASSMCRPQGLAYDDVHQRLFVAIQGQNRVTVYDLSGGITDGMDAVWVLGQPDFFSDTGDQSQSRMGAGIKVAYDPTRDLLYVQDGAARVLQYDVDTITNGEPALHVLGQADFDTTNADLVDDSHLGNSFNHSGLALDTTAQLLFVVDGETNTRVMVWDVNSITDGEPAVHVIGQPNFISSGIGGGTTGIREPWGDSFAAGRLYVGDAANNRILIFDTASLSDGEPAADLLGQLNPDDTPNFIAVKSNNGPNWQGFDSPHGVALDEENHRLFTADFTNNRVLVFNLNTDNSPIDYTADFVIGQPDFKSYASAADDPQAYNFNNGPQTVVYDGTNDRLFVNDANGSRVLIFDTSVITNGMDASWVLGQPNLTTHDCCAVSDHEFLGSEGLALDQVANLLYITDGSHNRVLVFDVDPSTIANGEAAVLVLGQALFTTEDSGTGPAGMNNPRGVAVDNSHQRIFVSDNGNRRILVFDLSDGIGDGEDAVNVLGQEDFTANVNATTQSTISDPAALFYDSSNDRLFASDPNVSRVLVFDVAVIADGEDAVDAYGQDSFTDMGCNTTQSGFCVPGGLYFDETLQTLYVADKSNNRVMIFGPASPTPTPGGGGSNNTPTPTPTPVSISPEGIVINDDDTSTDSRNVLVTARTTWSNGFTGTIDILLSNTSDFSTYVPFRFNVNDAVADRADWPKIIAWDLCWGLPDNTVCDPGTKTVYARFYTNVPLPKPALTPAP